MFEILNFNIKKLKLKNMNSGRCILNKRTINS